MAHRNFLATVSPDCYTTYCFNIYDALQFSVYSILKPTLLGYIFKFKFYTNRINLSRMRAYRLRISLFIR